MKRTFPVLMLCGIWLALATFQEGANADNRISSGPVVLVSSALPNLFHDEVQMAASPDNPNNLIACATITADSRAAGTEGTVVYTSSDGGINWKLRLTVNKVFTFDPACAYGSNGRAYFASLSSINKHGASLVYASTNDGVTWSPPTILPSTDRDSLTVDLVSKRFKGRVYLNATGSFNYLAGGAANESTGLAVFHSSDYAKTFGPGKYMLADPGRYILPMGNGAVLSDGSFFAILGQLRDAKTGWATTASRPNDDIQVVASNDGGTSFGPTVTISPWTFCNVSSTSEPPSIASDVTEGPFRGSLYATWPDMRYGHCAILLSYSRDHGKTWSEPSIVDRTWDEGSNVEDYLPTIALNKSGVIGMMWLQHPTPGAFAHSVFFSASNDGGETFSTPTVLSVAVPLPPGRYPLLSSSSGGGTLGLYGKGGLANVGIGILNFNFTTGDYAGLAADTLGRFHALWIASRAGIDQLWTSAIDVSENAITNGDSALARFKDVTSRVSFDMSHPAYDNGTITTTATITNTSDRPLQFPLKARVLSFGSKVGHASIVDSDNGEPSIGAVWSFGPESGTLLPGRATARTIHFHFTQLHEITAPPSGDPLAVFVQMKAKILSR